MDLEHRHRLSIKELWPLALPVGIIVGGILLRQYDQGETQPQSQPVSVQAGNELLPTALDTGLVSSELATDEIFVKQKVQGALLYVKSSGNDFLIENSQYETHQFPIANEKFGPEKASFGARPPESSFAQGEPESIDFYFRKGSEYQLETFLVINPDFINSQQITIEELAIILAQKGFVLRGLYPSLSHQIIAQNSSTEDLNNFANSQPILKLRGDLELNGWWAVANLALGPMQGIGELTSQRLQALIPNPVLTRPQMLTEGQRGFQIWQSRLSPSILPGLPHH